MSNDEEDDVELDKFILTVEKLNENLQEHNYLFRICLLGDAGVGKTSILSRFCDNTFKENYNNTIGVDFRLITLKQDNIISKLHIWDTAGQERFRSLASNYINNAHGFIFIYDITDLDSFNHVINWVDMALGKNPKTVVNFLVGNKSDNDEERKVSKEEAKNLAKEKNLFFLETSARNNDNIQKLFYFFLFELIKYYKVNQYQESEKIILKQENSEEISTQRVDGNKCKC